MIKPFCNNSTQKLISEKARDVRVRVGHIDELLQVNYDDLKQAHAKKAPNEDPYRLGECSFFLKANVFHVTLSKS